MAGRVGRTAFVFFCVVFLSVQRSGKSELFSALTHFQKLVPAEQQLASSLDDYIDQEEKRLRELRRFADEVQRALDFAERSASLEDYLGHPTNAYLLVRRFTNDWLDVEDQLRESEQERAKGELQS